MTVDTEHGIITGVDCYPANRRESDTIFRHVQRQMAESGLNFKSIAMDAGYDVGAVHRGFEHLGIVDYCSIRQMHNNAMRKGFDYSPEDDCFVCLKAKQLRIERLSYKKGMGTIVITSSCVASAEIASGSHIVRWIKAQSVSTPVRFIRRITPIVSVVFRRNTWK